MIKPVIHLAIRNINAVILRGSLGVEVLRWMEGPWLPGGPAVLSFSGDSLPLPLPAAGIPTLLPLVPASRSAAWQSLPSLFSTFIFLPPSPITSVLLSFHRQHVFNDIKGTMCAECQTQWGPCMVLFNPFCFLQGAQRLTQKIIPLVMFAVLQCGAGIWTHVCLISACFLKCN